MHRPPSTRPAPVTGARRSPDICGGPVELAPAPAPGWIRCRFRSGEPVRDDRGSTIVEFAILFPIIVVLLFTGPQLAMWYFARDAAQSAAAAAARAASLDGAAPGAGRTSAETFLAHVGHGTITSYSVTETDAATTVTIHIHAAVPNTIPLPGFSPTVDVTVVRGKERFTTPDSP
jgi:Flp pilus assembly protein TadG